MKAVFQDVVDKSKEAGKDIAPMTDALDSLMTVSMIQSVFSIGFAVLLLVAGIKLLKYQQSGRKLSNVWAISRMVVAIPLAFMSINANTKFQEEVQKLTPDNATLDMGAMAGVGGTIGVILVCIYPILSLIFVNNARAKASLK